MTMTTTDNKTREYADLARRFDYLADRLDAFAVKVEEWGAVEADPSKALGLISMADDLARSGRDLLIHELVGYKTKISHGNEASIALGVHESGNTSKLAYALMYRMTEDAKYGHATSTAFPGFNRMAVKVASIRCYASSARVVADLARGCAEGRYGGIG